MLNKFTGIKPNLEAEQSIIGAMLVDPAEIVPQALQILTADDFLLGEYGTIFKALQDMFLSGKAIDYVSVLGKVGEEYKLPITSAVQAVPSTANWRAYAKLVADNAKRKRAYESAELLMENLTDSADIEECQHWAMRATEHLSETRSDSTRSAKEGFYHFYASLQKPPEYIKTGLAKLDERLLLSRGDFVVVGGRPSAGKTALTLQMAAHMARTYTVVYFSLETRHNNIFGRLAANLSGIKLEAIKTHTADFAKLYRVHEQFDKLNLHVVQAAGWTVAQIKAKAIQLGAEVIFIDYLGLIKSDGKSLYERVSNVSLDLRTLALTSNIAVVALSQLSRDGKGVPNMAHLRESGQIEQDADAILLLYAPDEDDPTERILKVEKNKEGETGAIQLYFDGETQRFMGVDPRYGR